ncbi:MAG: glycosyltransferase [Chloroflexi bacterium]|nr:glycosyltransferase [Chloroflexota bacterium]
MATISLVMIVKDEEKVLRRSLDSVKAIVDEFVIVDTGSSDSTKDVIKEYGQLYERPFTNFVETKNEALKLANSDYILLLDADEYIIEGLEKLKEHAEDGVECVLARIIEGSDKVVSNTYFRQRLWRNDGQWYFEGPGVHEILSGPGPVVYDGEIKVRHDHSHRSAESYPQRFRKYAEILETYLVEYPNEPRATFYLARTYKDLEQPLAAITVYNRYLALDSGWHDERWQAAYDIALCWQTQGEYDKCEQACKNAIAIDPRRAEAFNLLGELYYNQQEWDQAIHWYEQALGLPFPEDIILFINPRAYFEVPMDRLMLCYDRKKQYRKAYDACQSIVSRLDYVDERQVNNLRWLNDQLHLKIFFALGQTPEPVYGGMIEEIGVGGLETTYCELSDVLAQMGHDVFVFCQCNNEHLYRGVRFIPYEQFIAYAHLAPDVIITSRWFEPMYISGLEKAKKIVWLQDAHFADPNRPDAFQVADAIVCSSRWHSQYTMQRLRHGITLGKLHIIPLGIRKALFFESLPRDPLKVIYSSNPDRGLYILADMWAKLSERIPGIHLAVTYGWEGLKTWSADPSWQGKLATDRQRMMDWAKTAGNVRFLGRLRKKELAKEMLSSSLCLYPNNFWETYCLTALESQAAGVPMITTEIGALSTTLTREGNVFAGFDPYSLEYQKRFIEQTVQLLSNTDELKALSQICRDYVMGSPLDWEDIGKKWEKLLWRIG